MSIEITHENAEETPLTRFVLPLRDALQTALDSTDEEEVLELPSGVSIRIESWGTIEKGFISVNLIDAEDDSHHSEGEAAAGGKVSGCARLRRVSGQWHSSPPKLQVSGGGYGARRRNYGWPKIGTPLSPKAHARVIELVEEEARSIARRRREAVDLDSRLTALKAWHPDDRLMIPGWLVDLNPPCAATQAHNRLRWELKSNTDDPDGVSRGYNAPEPRLVDPNLAIGFKLRPDDEFLTVVSEEGSGYRATLMHVIASLGFDILAPAERARLQGQRHYEDRLDCCFSNPEQLNLLPGIHTALVEHYQALLAAKKTEDAISDVFRPKESP